MVSEERLEVRDQRSVIVPLIKPGKILVVQTAFLGDVILTLPLVQVAKKVFPDAQIDVVTVPKTASVLRNHPDIREVVEFDKRGKDSGLLGLWKMSKELHSRKYDVAIVPHRSLRSAMLVKLSKISTRVAFDKSSGRWMYSHTVPYRQGHHEVERNISLLEALGVRWADKELPNLYPSEDDRDIVDKIFNGGRVGSNSSLIAIAPGTVWNTKRWLKERFADLAQRFADDGCNVVLIGGEGDSALCDEIKKAALRNGRVHNFAGQLSLLQSAELLRRCRLLVCNDSAPMHLAVAMRTPVVAVFGATVPEFGFAPYGKQDVVVETKGLECRPCSIHGGDACPIRTFVCMKNIPSDMVYKQANNILETAKS